MSDTRFDHAVVVLGMHRSGTSALTGVLGSCGLSVPATLIPSSQANERGFWESDVLNSLNNSILEKVGQTWRSLEPIDAATVGPADEAAITRQITEALCAEFENRLVPLIKDPRICRLLPFWEPALATLSGRMSYPFILRHPVEVASSLKQRNDIDFDHALLLWARYYLDAELATRGKARAFVNYSSLIDDWRKAIGFLHSRLSLPFDLRSVDEAAIDNYLSVDLRHQNIPEQSLFDQGGRLPILLDAHGIFSRWADGGREEGADYAVLDEARRHLDRIGPLLSGVVEKVRVERKRRVVALARAEKAVADLARANRALDTLGGLSEQLTRMAADTGLKDAVGKLEREQEERFTDLSRRVKKLFQEASERAQAASEGQNQAISAAHNAIERLVAGTESLSERQSTGFIAIKQQVEALRSDLDDRRRFDTALADALDHSKSLRRQIEGLEQQVEDGHALVRFHLQEIQSRDAEARKVKERLDWVSEEWKIVKRKYRATQASLERETERLSDAKNRLAYAEATVSRYRRSHAWQVYMLVARSLTRLRSLISSATGNSSGRRRELALSLLGQSSLFDPEWYLATYSDVASSSADPLRHYFDHGWLEGRDPGPHFSTTAYLKAHSDVAAQGINPLLHYVEFGHSEGRGAPEQSRSAAQPLPPRQLFGDAAPCTSFTLPGQDIVAWRRAAQFDPASHAYRLPSGLAVGVLRKDEAAAFEEAIEQLAWLSGASDGAPALDLAAVAHGTSGRLIDAWYTGRNLLRSRWRLPDGESSMVVRILQNVGGALELIGEALVIDDLDVVDAKLGNAFFPILFVFTDSEGAILGRQLLAFPSLCRGGLHHAELGLLPGSPGGQEVDPSAVGAGIAARLLAIRGGAAEALIGNLAVDLTGADGTHPLFQPDFRRWLSLVASISVRALDDDNENEAYEYLAGALFSIDHARATGRTGATLTMRSDMVPSLAALSARAGAEQVAGRTITGSIIAPALQLSEPALLARQPEGLSAVETSSFARNFPLISLREGWAALDDVPAYAIRLASPRPLSDAELLVPVSPPGLPAATGDTRMTWLFWPQAWREQDLLQSLEALAAQSDGGPQSIIFVGTGADAAGVLALRLFDGRVKNAAGLDEVPTLIETPLVGFIGASVILHDRRTTGVLTRLLEEPSNVSASVLLMSIERRGKGFLVAPVDEGAGSLPGTIGVPPDQAIAATRLVWGASWRAHTPPGDLWLIRAEDLERFMDPDNAESATAVHACTSQVIASYCGPRLSAPPEIIPAPALPGNALRIELVV